MFASLAPLVLSGVIDNTVRGAVVLHLLCTDADEPLRIEMQGDCLADIAGCKVGFTHTSSTLPAGSQADVMELLRGYGGDVRLGDITLSRRERVGRGRSAKLRNLLSIEFFLGSRVRLFIETPDFSFRFLEPPCWIMGEAEENIRLLLNRDVMRDHVLYSVAHFQGPAFTAAQEDGIPISDWDVRLNRAEAYMALLSSVREKYRGRPDACLCEAYVFDRPDLLAEAAEEWDAVRARGGNPARKLAVRRYDWEVLDFLEPDQVDSVMQAVRHPLFCDTSRVTEAVNEHVVKRMAVDLSAKPVHDFLTSYSAIISHLLATLLIMQDGGYDSALVLRRLVNIGKRLLALIKIIQFLPEPARRPVQDATEILVHHLGDFYATMDH